MTALEWCARNVIADTIRVPGSAPTIRQNWLHIRNGKTVAQLAIAWVLRKEEVTAAIVGARKQKQIEETVQAGDWVLGEEDIKEIETVLK